MNRNKKTRVAAMGDLHVSESLSFDYGEIFARISKEADVLVLCGDLTDLGLPEEAKILARHLSACAIPAIGVLGNHDFHSGRIEEVKKILSAANLFFLDEDRNFEINNLGFAGVKGFGGGFDEHILSFFGEKGIKDFVSEALNESLKLENSLRTLNSEKKIAIMHYSPIPGTIKGEAPEIYPFLGSSRLAEAADLFGVEAVFHGHAHYGSLEGRTKQGAKVYNCCLKVLRKKYPLKPYLLVEI